MLQETPDVRFCFGLVTGLRCVDFTLLLLSSLAEWFFDGDDFCFWVSGCERLNIFFKVFNSSSVRATSDFYVKESLFFFCATLTEII